MSEYVKLNENLNGSSEVKIDLNPYSMSVGPYKIVHEVKINHISTIICYGLFPEHCSNMTKTTFTIEDRNVKQPSTTILGPQLTKTIRNESISTN